MRQHFLEHEAQRIVVAGLAVPILCERQEVRYGVFQTKTTEPLVSQVQMNFFVQPTFGADTKTANDDQHPNHQYWVNRWLAGVTAMRS